MFQLFVVFHVRSRAWEIVYCYKTKEEALAALESVRENNPDNRFEVLSVNMATIPEAIPEEATNG